MRKKLILVSLLAYLVFIILLCFSPQESLFSYRTPGIQYFGPVPVLLTPFNSLVHLGKVTSLGQLVWIFTQNLLNIFLLYPFLLGLLWLKPSLRKMKKIVLVAFLMSLGIELTQVLLDVTIDANRVFELDDLWTNTLGGYLAYKTYTLVKKVGEA